MMLRLSGAPHLVTHKDTRTIMLLVLIALLPTSAAGVYLFGWNALMLIAVSCIGAVASEWAWQKLAKKPVRIGDLSALVTGLILALNLPASAPWWIALIGSVFAIIVVKQLYGGIGHNFMNPAMAARAMLLASWPARMTTWVLPTCFSGADAVSSATALAGGQFSYLDLFIGNVPGTIGEVCKVAILVGFAFLLITDVIKWRVPVIFLSTTADETGACFGGLLAEIFAYEEDAWAPALRHMGFYLGKYIYLLDAYDDLDRDAETGSFNPLLPVRKRMVESGDDFDGYMRSLLNMLMASCCRAFEALPIVENVDILRNILYSGVWTKFEEIYAKRTGTGADAGSSPDEDPGPADGEDAVPSAEEDPGPETEPGEGPGQSRETTV